MSATLVGRLATGPAVGLAECFGRCDPPPLWPGELEAVRRAVQRRRDEFARGRACARNAMRAAALLPCSIPAGRDRAPRWPGGVVGSISHTDGYCVAAVASTAHLRAIGVDAEPAEPIERELWDTICSDEERTALIRQGIEPGHAVRAIFSAKEAFYKAQYPLTGEFLEFREVNVVSTRGSLAFTLHRQVGEFAAGPTPFEGRLVISGGLVLSGALLRAG